MKYSYTTLPHIAVLKYDFVFLYFVFVFQTKPTEDRIPCTSKCDICFWE